MRDYLVLSIVINFILISVMPFIWDIAIESYKDKQEKKRMEHDRSQETYELKSKVYMLERDLLQLKENIK